MSPALRRLPDVRRLIDQKGYLKVWRSGRPDPLQAGMSQLDACLSSLGGEAAGWLVIFDRRPDQPPAEERTTAERAKTPAGRDVTVIRA